MEISKEGKIQNSGLETNMGKEVQSYTFFVKTFFSEATVLIHFLKFWNLQVLKKSICKWC